MPAGRSAKHGKSPVENAPGERPGCCGIPTVASSAARACWPCPCATPTMRGHYRWWWSGRAGDVSRGICSPMSPWKQRSKRGKWPSPTSAAIPRRCAGVGPLDLLIRPTWQPCFLRWWITLWHQMGYLFQKFALRHATGVTKCQGITGSPRAGSANQISCHSQTPWLFE
jgi:hypothetical protein